MGGVVVDTSVWVAHFREANETLIGLLAQDLVLVHPLIIGEIACGSPPNRSQTLADLSDLQTSQQASLGEVMAFIEREKLFGQGCGIVDLTLIASTLLTPGSCIWTLDKRLCAIAMQMNVLFQAPVH